MRKVLNFKNEEEVLTKTPSIKKYARELCPVWLGEGRAICHEFVTDGSEDICCTHCGCFLTENESAVDKSMQGSALIAFGAAK